MRKEERGRRRVCKGVGEIQWLSVSVPNPAPRRQGKSQGKSMAAAASAKPQLGVRYET
jgi:hypothetical protein